MAELIEHRDESLRLADLVVLDDRMSTWLDGHAFVNCEVIGPAVLILTQNVVLDQNAMDVAMFWEIDPGRSYAGGIGLRNCRFQRCSFRDVGIAADRATLQRFGV